MANCSRAKKADTDFLRNVKPLIPIRQRDLGVEKVKLSGSRVRRGLAFLKDKMRG